MDNNWTNDSGISLDDPSSGSPYIPVLLNHQLEKHHWHPFDAMINHCWLQGRVGDRANASL